MRNTKSIVFSAVSGFILSLIFGIFSKSGFFRVLLIALIWAVVFAGMAILINIIFEKFLAVEGTPDYSSQTQSSPAGIVTQSSSVGNNIDIVVEDQELDRSESANRYSVGENHQMLNDSDISGKPEGESSSVQNDNPGFVPVRNLETFKNFSGTESVKPSEVASAKEEELEEMPEVSGSGPESNVSTAAPVSSSDDALDVLPDMGEYVTSGNTNTNDGFGYESSGYSDSSYGNNNKKVEGENMQNTELIAKAISSVLSAET